MMYNNDMSIRKVQFIEGEFYHVYNRGNSKQIIFKNNSDYLHFIDLLYIANTDENFKLFDLKRSNHFNVFSLERKNNLVAIVSYCLMPNHFHILLTPLTENGVSKFMQKLSTGYSMYFNKRYKRTGALFEGKFKSEHADKDQYLKYLFSYIHLNPIKLIDKNWKEKGIQNKNKALKFLHDYKYSSYTDYLEIERKEKKILNRKYFGKYFTKQKFQKEIFEWLSYPDLR